jgi:hypothetical protein
MGTRYESITAFRGTWLACEIRRSRASAAGFDRAQMK